MNPLELRAALDATNPKDKKRIKRLEAKLRHAQRPMGRAYRIWMCDAPECHHKIARDLIDPEPPRVCRGKHGCRGQYRPWAYSDPEETKLTPAEDRQRDENLCRSILALRGETADGARERIAGNCV